MLEFLQNYGILKIFHLWWLTEIVIIVITINGDGNKGDSMPWLHKLTSTTQYYLKQISFVFLSKEIVILQDFSLSLLFFFFLFMFQ